MEHFLFPFALTTWIFFWKSEATNFGEANGELLFQATCTFFLAAGFGYYSLKRLITDYTFARGFHLGEKNYSVTIEPGTNAVLGPVAGRGRCQLRFVMRRLAEDANCDGVMIRLTDANGDELDSAEFGFAFDEEHYEVELDRVDQWSVSLYISRETEHVPTMALTVRMRAYGQSNEFTSPDHFDNQQTKKTG